MRIGLLGGSFNPPHEGHLHVSDVALKRLGLDFVWWLVSPQNPLKPVHGMASLEERLEQARRLTRRMPRIRVTDIEAQLGTRYTIDTVVKLTQRFPAPHYVWLMGSDNLMTFHHWRSWQELARRIPIAVVIRPGSTLATLTSKAAHRLVAFTTPDERSLATTPPPAFAILDARRSAASATAIRAGVGRNDCRVLE
ncbi:MAG TPA: nicotinate-nucleotide adenylyltransferase [Rhizomicrobium sp.]|nr:nicotinate-nucleotide adenylyltransferase [Rhizomicrobium sp.]